MTSHPQHLRGQLVAAALVAALSISCDEPTAPDPVHTAGTTSGRLTIEGAPSGIAVSRRGTVHVTLLEKNEIARFTAAAPTALESPIPVAIQPRHVVINNAGTSGFVAAADLDRWVVYTLDVGAGSVPFARQMQRPPYQVAISQDDSRIFVLMFGDPGQVYSYPITDQLTAKQFVVQIPGISRGLAVSPTTGALYVATTARIARLDPATLEIQAMVGPIALSSRDIVVSPDGSRVWYGSVGGNLVALDATSLDKVAEVTNDADVYGLAMSPDGAQLLATSGDQLLVVDPAAGSIVKRLTLGGIPAHIAFDRSGTVAFVANESGWVDVIR